VKKPLVSIVVPIYNHEKYLEECLNSFLKLEYSNFEIVLCNDGSTDQSLEIADAWVKAHQSVKVKLLTQENQGICKTLNRLIVESNGDFITICASDDALTKNSIQKRIDLLEANRETLACVGDANLINENSELISTSAMRTLYNSNVQRLKNDLKRELVFRWSVVGPTLLIKRTAYEEVGYYNEELLVEDRDFYLRLMATEKLIFIDMPVANYRVHTLNSSRKSLSAKLLVNAEVSKSNVNNAHSYDGLEKMFLLSHHIDLYLISDKMKYISFFTLSVFKVSRKIVFNFLRAISFWK
jgi:alpha-1,3-rhamnosyltransferase